MPVMSLRLSDDQSDTLARLAQATGRSKNFLAAQALDEYLAREAWQIGEIQQAIVEADAGDFASEAEVEAVLNKWTRNAG
ncbi:Predicted transcriptional regulator [Pseudomonas delhiensis]|uniref:Predicted transcriptional regulator n=1 Tax=Pseudomonas delhiensis TaxID=366289 RepID=A0A239DQ07_9PSED|nr:MULTISPECIES: ribbon-helix-helix protein, CopG family [Pseudomonas]MED5606863.1 ribbon-helix-helix protein, CopG family [Pseudomonas sp. JH-2]PWU30486.1 ribbon-helix-helix protein, CopG family [Pseudomonas sp. RW407]SDI89365.1 Predicted transcriptional regulator [Pseudomonas delhiensis]SNS33978.1 Predicted transcriptional regulator [Pseudomonas delhiensis]